MFYLVLRTCFLFSFSFFPSHLLSSPFYSLSLLRSRNSDPWSHSRLFSPPSHYGSGLAFYRDNISALSSLVDSRWIVLTHARRSQQLIFFFRYYCFCKQIQNLATAGFELTDQHWQHSRATTSPPERPAIYMIRRTEYILYHFQYPWELITGRGISCWFIRLSVRSPMNHERADGWKEEGMHTNIINSIMEDRLGIFYTWYRSEVY